MALTFSEGSIGGDIERVIAPRSCEAFYGGSAPSAVAHRGRRRHRARSRPARTASRSRRRTRRRARAAADQSAHVVLLPLRSADDERRRAERLRRVTWGQFFIYQGFNERAGWMHTSSGVDVIDEYARDDREEGRQLLLSSTATEERPVIDAEDHGAVQDRRRRWRRRSSRSIARITVRSCARRTASGSAIALMQEPVKALTQSYTRTKAKNYDEFQQDDGAAHELVEQHDLRRRRRQHRVLPRQLHPEARPEVRLDEAGRRQRSGDRVEGPACASTRARIVLNPASGWLYNTNNWPWSARPARTARSKATIRRTWTTAARTRAAFTRSAC